jgi:hypothetical protein
MFNSYYTMHNHSLELAKDPVLLLGEQLFCDGIDMHEPCIIVLSIPVVILSIMHKVCHGSSNSNSSARNKNDNKNGGGDSTITTCTTTI